MDADPVQVNAKGMKCPWPALRAARAMREADAIMIEADDPIAPSELAALAQQQGWDFAAVDSVRFLLRRMG
ncbi:MAG: sulfurtransferase TusA family protein [Sphingomonadaceae bacterium]|nr:sulfurtransferase TusA family protein [Sphingomonadaceae bacterium]MBH2000598.1 sulfurtransferase TusA family protein [Sphingomonadaceae bacterium]